MAGHAGGLDEENLAAGRGPGEAADHAGGVNALGRIGVELLRAEELLQVIEGDRRKLGLALGEAAG